MVILIVVIIILNKIHCMAIKWPLNPTFSAYCGNPTLRQRNMKLSPIKILIVYFVQSLCQSSPRAKKIILLRCKESATFRNRVRSTDLRKFVTLFVSTTPSNQWDYNCHFFFAILIEKRFCVEYL